MSKPTPPPPPPSEKSSAAGDESSGDKSTLMKGDKAEEAKDFANYFCSYAFLYHQKQMLTDHNRMASYHSAVMQNKELFKDKVVLDIGTGSGILACWCAMAGAKKVYAVEYTAMSKHAAALVAHNGLDKVVEVIRSSAEDLTLDCGEGQVDIIISEWMGYFLLRESMADSLLRARDKWLRPTTGLMFPSAATMYWGIVECSEDRRRAEVEYEQVMEEWYTFVEDTQKLYGVDMSVLGNSYEREQLEYYMMQAVWMELAPEQVVGEPVPVKTLEMHDCSFGDVRDFERTPFRFVAPQARRVTAFAGWFDADFAGRPGLPCARPVRLDTAPVAGYTHWGQQCFYLPSAVHLRVGDVIEGTVAMVRQEESERLYDVLVTYTVRRAEGASARQAQEDQECEEDYPVRVKYNLS